MALHLTIIIMKYFFFFFVNKLKFNLYDRFLSVHLIIIKNYNCLRKVTLGKQIAIMISIELIETIFVFFKK